MSGLEMLAAIKPEQWRAVAPAVHNPTELHLPEATELMLPNGIRLTVVDSGESEVNRLSIAMGSGELEGRNAGISKLGAQLLNQGTRSYSGAALADIMEFNGAWTDISSHQHHRVAHFYSLNHSFDRLLPAMVEILTCPTFPEEEFAAFRDNSVSKIENDRCKVSVRAHEGANQLLYGEGHPLSAVLTPEVIRSVSRDEVAQFHSRALAASGTHLYLGGRITDSILESVTSAFGALRLDGPGIEAVNVKPRPASAGTVRHITMPQSKQSAITLTFPTIGRQDADYVMLRLVVTALGGYFGSRLNANIREEKGLTYGITAALLGLRDTGSVEINCQTDPANVDRVIDEVRAEMLHMSTGRFTHEELERLRRYYLTNLLAVLESPFSITDYYLTQLLADTPTDYFAQQLQALETINADIIADISSRYLDPDKLLIATAGQ